MRARVPCRGLKFCACATIRARLPRTAGRARGGRVAKNILILSMAPARRAARRTRRAARYKLLRATRVSPDTTIDPKRRLFYDGGLARALRRGHQARWWRRIYNLLAQRRLGITRTITDAEIIRVAAGRPIYCSALARCYPCAAAGRLNIAACRPRSAAPARHEATTAARSEIGPPVPAGAVKAVYQHRQSVRRDPPQEPRRAPRVPCKYSSATPNLQYRALFVGVWERSARRRRSVACQCS